MCRISKVFLRTPTKTNQGEPRFLDYPGKCQELPTCRNRLFRPSRYFRLEIRHFGVEAWEGKGNLACVALPPHVLNKILDYVPDRLTGLINLLRLCGWTGTTNQG